MTAWGSAALYFGDSHTGNAQIALALLFACSGLSAIIALAFPHWRKLLVLSHVVFFTGVLLWWLTISPSNDRVWQPDVAKLAYATFAGNQVTVHNIRNFDYQSEFDYRPSYYDKAFDLDKLQGIDLYAVYWMGPAIAHILISFDFGDENHLAISIEARKEANESYSSIKGFFRQYELIYIVADERDVVRLRTNYRHNPEEDVYLYPIRGPKENAKRLFLDYIKKLNALRDKPVFYNTFNHNCTNTIWLHSKVNPGHLPFSWKILVSGYVPEYLYDQGRLDRSISFSELQKRSRINDSAQQADQALDFSARIRQPPIPSVQKRN